MTRLNLCVLMFVLMMATRIGYAAVVITPDAAGNAASGYQKFSTAIVFDAQPAITPVAGTTTDTFGGNNFSLYTDDGRGIYIDFGVNWNQVTIEEVWLGLKQYGTSPTTGTLSSYWSPLGTVTSAEADGVAAPDFLWNWTADTTDNSRQQVWSGTETVTVFLCRCMTGQEAFRTGPRKLYLSAQFLNPPP